MNENIISILKTLTVDFFTAFGLYSFLFLISSIFIKKAILYTFDEQAKKFISFVGVLYIFIWFLGLFVYYFESNPTERTEMINRLFGKYWFGIWIQPIFWFLLSQTFRIKRFSNNILIRIFASFFLMISIERIVIIMTSFHRDYLPSSWTMYNDLGIYSSIFILSIILKIIFFGLFVLIYSLITNKINQFQLRNK
jgi:molybdopterin-containing oxidoreductase family membrane subunit